MVSFPAKIGWTRLRKRENKNYRPVLFLPEAQQKIPKKQQKKSKNYKIPLWLLLKPKQGGKEGQRDKIKIIVPFRSNLIRNTKFKKKQQKNSKN